VLLVIFGAGASYDSVPHLPPPTALQQSLKPARHEEFRLPLANQLFENRPGFVSAMERFGRCLPLVPLLRTNTPVEQQLATFQQQAKTFPERHAQLLAIRFYLHFSLWECQRNWLDLHRGITNYATFLDGIERWRFEKDERVCLVTFNYDTMLEQAMQQVLGRTFNDFSQYASDAKYKLIKLHGSIDWGHDALTPTGKRDATDLIEWAERLTVSEQYRKVTQHPMVFDDGSRGFPALAIPVEKKSEFACPLEHIQALAQVIPSITKIITVGWRATEDHFLKMLRAPLTGLQDDVDLMIISGNDAGMRETAQNLKIGEPNTQRKRALMATGFTGSINNIGHLEIFLR
jgi:hypothetical protein